MSALMQVLLSYFPLVPFVATHTCAAPAINIMVLQAMATASNILLGVPTPHALLSSALFAPFYLALDWRYAALNGLPGCRALLSYLWQRGLLLLAARLLFPAAPLIVASQSRLAPQTAVYAVCLPLLAIQYFVSPGQPGVEQRATKRTNVGWGRLRKWGVCITERDGRWQHSQ